MDNNNWRPTTNQGPVGGTGGGGVGGEHDLDAGDWRNQLQPDSRSRIVDKMPRNPVSSLQQGQLPPLHMDSMQQPQSPINHIQSQDNQMNPQLLSVAGHTNGGDWQEEVYQKIKIMKEMYLPELNEMYQKITTKLQQHDSLPQQPKLEQLDKLKQFKNRLERIITFLRVSKSDISLNMKEKLVSYEKQILNFITTSRPRNPVSSLMGMTSQVHNQGQSLPIPLSANSQARQQVMSQNIQNSVASAGVQTSACLPSSLPDLNAEYCWPED